MLRTVGEVDPEILFKVCAGGGKGKCLDCKEKNCNDSSHHRERGALVPYTWEGGPRWALSTKLDCSHHTGLSFGK